MAIQFSSSPGLAGAFFVLISLLAYRAPDSFASVVNAALQSVIGRAPTDSLLSVVIRPVGVVNAERLKSEVLDRYPTRAEQHREVISALKKAADDNQPPVLDALKSVDLASHVYNVRSYWIDNVITAEMSASAITALAARDDIESILLLPDITLVTPLSAGSVISPDQLTVPNHIRAIKADSVWLAGFTGKGRLVGSLDTGVDGKHFSLASKWRGHNGASASESWHDPIYGDTIPRYFAGSGVSHGTRVMGLMVAVIPGFNDTLGACPDCQWISAAAIDIPCPTLPHTACGNLFGALQWIADPDSDPNTDWDVPDAIANPWGAVTKGFSGCEFTGIGCSDIFWNAIDNIEAAGTLMVFAAGNEGNCGAMTIRNPANRIGPGTSTFSTGMVDTRFDVNTPPVDPLSSQGPSDCDGTSIKPELVAPGVELRSTVPNNGVSAFGTYGTSFPTALVTAGAALLREYNPNATVDQLKTALLAGAKDLGNPGPDNSYGHGLLDLMEALRQLPPNTDPAVYVMRDAYNPPAPGTNEDILFVLRNCGTPAIEVEVSLTTTDPRLTIIDGQAIFADMVAYGDSADNASDPFEIAVDALCLPGERLPVTIEILANGGYSRTIGGAIHVGPRTEKSLFTHDAGNFRMSIGEAGSFGHAIDGLAPRPGGVGYLFASDPTQSLFDGGFLIGTDVSHVSDNARSEYGSYSAEFRVDPGGHLAIREPSEQWAEETRSAFDDSWAKNPIGLFIEQRTMVSDEPGHEDYLIVEYTLYNRSETDFEELYCGLFFDWDFPWTGETATRDGGGFDSATGMGWMRHRDENRFRGVCIISDSPLSGYKYFDNLAEVYDGISDFEKWEAMTGGTLQALPSTEGDGSHLIAAGPITLGPGSSARVAFAVIGATSEAALRESAAAARAHYDAFRSSLDIDIDILPGVCPNIVSLFDPIAVDRPRTAKAIPGRAEVEVAVLSRDGFDAFDLDAASSSMLGLSPIRWRVADVGGAHVSRESGECECTSSRPDGKADLVLSFDRDQLLEALADVEGNHLLHVHVTDQSKIPYMGRDCLRPSNKMTNAVRDDKSGCIRGS